MGALTTTEYRWLLPAGLGPAADAGRSTRDWVIDVLCFVLGYGFTVLVTWDLLRPHPTFLPGFADDPVWLVWLDFVVGTVAAAALWFRRRWAVPTMLILVPISVFSLTAAISTVILLFTVAVHQRFALAAGVLALVTPANAAFMVIRPENGSQFWSDLAWITLLTALIMLWGMVVRSRRQLVLSLRDRAERAESEQQLRVAQARSLERTRIAREMHDVLAHRISLLSLHAGALEIRPDASPAEVAGAAGVIRASAHQALQDLREVIGVLRSSEPAGGIPEPPQPTLAALPALTGESRAAGMRVRLDLQVGDAAVPEMTGRTAYRIVQEGLTNARKHAPGTAVNVTVGGEPGRGLTVDVRNPWPLSGVGGGIPGTGIGLVGLAERTTLAGGRLTHGRTPAGDFELTAWLPWPSVS